MKDGLINIEIGGKHRTLKFNMRAIETFSEIKNGGNGTLSAAASMIYSGLIGYYYAKQVEPDFTFEDVNDWVEELIYDGKEEIISKIDKCFGESRALIYFMKKVDEAKKKTA